MNTAKIIKKLREQTGMNRREFSAYTKIPVRTLDDVTTVGDSIWATFAF